MTQQKIKKPEGFLKAFFRAPVYLYRWHLGWMMGKRFVLLNLIGRKSGKLRQTVVEVIRYDSTTDTHYIASGYGIHAQWYKNLVSHPQITIQVGSRKLTVKAQQLDIPQATEELRTYSLTYPRAAKGIGKLINLEWDGNPEQAPVIAQAIPIFALRPSQK